MIRSILPLDNLLRPKSISRKWVVVSYVLAALYLLSVVCSLIIQHRLYNEYRDSLAQNKAWSERNKDYVKFGQDASLLNASGSEVTAASDADSEWKKARQAKLDFDEQFLKDQKDIKTNVSGPDAEKLLTDLNVVKAGMDSLTKETDAVFSYFRQNKPEKAREALPGVDQRYHNMIRAFYYLRDDVADLHKPHL